MNKIKISICGGSGKMGRMLIKKIFSNSNFILHSVTDKNSISLKKFIQK